MIIKVEQCFNGHELYFRLTLPDGKRQSIMGDKWVRETSTIALDILERVYGLTRRNIRFIHH